MNANQTSLQGGTSPKTALAVARVAGGKESTLRGKLAATKTLVERLIFKPAPAAPFSNEWAAGFVDGEACLHIARQTYRCGRNHTYRLRVAINQNNLEVLEHFKSGMGIPATLCKVKRTAQHNRQVYLLNYDGAHAMALIAVLRPYLVRKRPEADTAFAFWVDGRMDMRTGRQPLPPEVVAVRHRLYLKLQSLK